MRGIEVLLLEKGDFCAGASGGNHGVLHSGARYAVKDPGSARDCATENHVLRRIAPFCIEECGGTHVSLPGDDASYPEAFVKACRSTGVRCSPLSQQEALAREPLLTPDLVKAFEVDDASLDPFSLVLANIESAREAGAEALNYQAVQSFRTSRGGIDEVLYRDVRTGEAEKVKPEVVVNASGAWAGGVASLAGASLPVQVDRGSMVVMDGRHCHGLVNRLRPPSDGDIAVPNHTATVLGTTSSTMAGPGPVCASREEAKALIREMAKLLPSLAKGRAIRAYAGIRPLSSAEKGRDASRGFKVVAHHGKKASNLVSVLGGKLTIYRLMAERASDAVCKILGSSRACRTAQVPLYEDEGEPRMDGVLAMYSRRLLRKYGPGRGRVADSCSRAPRGKDLACTCEQVMQGELDHFASHPDVRTLGDLNRRTRAGMGYCQSGTCALSMLSALAQRTEQDPGLLLEEYLTERWKGLWPVLEGEQLRQEVLKRYLLTGTYQLRIMGAKP